MIIIPILTERMYLLVDAHKPVFRRKRLLDVLQREMLVSNLHIPSSVEARRRPVVELQMKQAKLNSLRPDILVTGARFIREGVPANSLGCHGNEISFSLRIVYSRVTSSLCAVLQFTAGM